MSVLEIFRPLLDGAVVTIVLLLVAFVLGNMSALFIALIRTSSRTVPKTTLNGFCDFIRGTPLLVQMYIIYYSGGALLLSIDGIRQTVFWPIVRDGFWYAALALIINTAAYSSEVIKGAIEKVGTGEIEAAQALGLSKSQITRLIVVPRALRLCLPVLGGETIMLLKATSVASLVTVMDLMGQANLLRMTSFDIYRPLLAAAAIYMTLAFILDHSFQWVEKRWAVGS